MAKAYFSEAFFGMIGACLRTKVLTAGGFLSELSVNIMSMNIKIKFVEH